MTKSEAIEFIKERIALIDSDYTDILDYKEALQISVKALEKADIEETYKYLSICKENRLRSDEEWKIMYVLPVSIMKNAISPKEK